MKTECSGQKTDVIQGLQKMLNNYETEMKLFKETIKNDKNAANREDVLKYDQIFSLVGALYRLPIHGPLIREQVDRLTFSQGKLSSKREVYVELPSKANSSKLMSQFKNALVSK